MYSCSLGFNTQLGKNGLATLAKRAKAPDMQGAHVTKHMLPLKDVVMEYRKIVAVVCEDKLATCDGFISCHTTLKGNCAAYGDLATTKYVESLKQYAAKANTAPMGPMTSRRRPPSANLCAPTKEEMKTL